MNEHDDDLDPIVPDDVDAEDDDMPADEAPLGLVADEDDQEDGASGVPDGQEVSDVTPDDEGQ